MNAENQVALRYGTWYAKDAIKNGQWKNQMVDASHTTALIVMR